MKKYVIGAILIIIFGITILFMFPQRQEMRMLNLGGLESNYKNKLINISQKYAIADNRIYFIKGTYGGQLYSMDLSGKNITKVSDDEISDFKLGDKWIFYSNADGLLKRSFDGSTKIKLATGNITKIQIINNEIFYSILKEKDLGELELYTDLYKVDIEGKSNVKVCEDMPFDFVIVDNNIFYTVSSNPYFNLIKRENVDKHNSQQYKLYKMSLDSTNKERVTDVDSLSLDYSNNKVFYYKNNGLYSMNSNDISTETNIMEFIPYDIFIDEPDIYYNDDVHSIYRLDMKSGVKKRVIKSLSDIEQVDVIGDWVFYETSSKSLFGEYIHTTWVINKDGSQKQMFMRY